MREPPLLAVMAKAPVCGAVKTRLAREIGAVSATALARTLTAALLRKLTKEARFGAVLAVTPDHAASAPYAAWSLKGLRRIGQGRGSLGERMQRIFDCCGRGPLIIVGTDIPFVSSSMIADAFRRLGGSDAIFGRAEDGGYWLVGLRRRPKRLAPFENVRWSSPHALTDTLNNLARHRIAFAATLFDIDTEADYRRYKLGDEARRVDAAGPRRASPA
jgi:hypothetical protein